MVHGLSPDGVWFARTITRSPSFSEFRSLKGVMQAPGGADEDVERGFGAH
jgi:hypothetical protein